MEMSVLAMFTGFPEDEGYWPCDLTYRDAVRICREAGLDVDETEPGDSEYAYLAEESVDPESSDWARCADITASGIISREAFDEMVDSLGAFAEDCETMGTLGGPLAPWGGIVPDVSFRVESECLIDSIRVTPVPNCANTAKDEADAGRIWDRLRRAVLSVYGI